MNHLNFRGNALVVREGEVLYQCANGYADLANERKNRLDTKFAIASGSKGFTAVGILKLVEEGRLSLQSRIGDLLDFELHEMDPNVTVEQLLTHTSGVPDYFDESVMDDYDELWVDFPCYKIRTSRELLPLFIHKPMMYPRGERFQYNNTGFVLLGIMTEIVTGKPFDAYLQESLFDPAGMTNTGYYETDRLPGNCANAYMRDRRTGELCTNIFAVDVKGTGAGGAYTTVEDMARFWQALYAGKILSMDTLRLAHSRHAGSEQEHYGLGFWLNPAKEGYVPHLEGCDPGVCFMSEYFPARGMSFTVISNYGDNVWEVEDALKKQYL